MMKSNKLRTVSITSLLTVFVISIAASAPGQTLDSVMPNGSTSGSTVHQMPGLALAQKTAEVAAIVDQRLVTVHVTEGQQVKKGQLLATLEYGVSRAEYEAAKAIAGDHSGVNIAQIDVNQAQSRFERFKVALASGAGNELELRQAQNELEKAMALLAQEQSQLVRAKKTAETAAARVDAYIVRAPFSGIVTEQHISIGNLAQAGMPIFSIVSPSVLRVELNLPLELYGKLKSGQAYEMTGGVPVSKLIKANLKFVSPTIDSASQSFRCVFEIENKDLSLPAGFPIQLSDQQVVSLVKNKRDSSVAQK